jgi:hypothetical protein
MGADVAFQAVWSNWQSVAVAAAVLSLLFAALAYALSRFFRTRSLELWAKDEIYQALASAFIVGAAVIIITAISSFSCSISGKCVGSQDHVDAAINIMGNMTSNVTKQLEHIFYLSMRVGMITKMGKFYDFTIGPDLACIAGYCLTAFGFNFYWWAGGSMIADSIDYTFSILLPIISSFIAQMYMLMFIKEALFPTLLAMGIILRTFFFSRKVGGLLIAIALALYTVYPLMYIMLESYFTYTPHTFYYPDTDFTRFYADASCWGNFLPEGESNKPFCTGIPGLIMYIIPGLPMAVGNYGEATYMFKNGCVSDADCPTSSCATGVLDQGRVMNICDPSNPPDVYAGMRSQYNGVLPTVGYLMVPAVFIPLLIILVTISFIKVLSPQLGGDVEIAGLTKIL